MENRELLEDLLMSVHQEKKYQIKKYQTLMSQIDFELGAISSKCLKTYREMGKNYYSDYKPLNMILQTDVFFNFIEANYYLIKEQDGISLSQAYDIYKTYCDESLIEFKLPRHKFREELKNYFKTFSDVSRIDGKQTRSFYSGFITSKFSNTPTEKEEHPYSLVLDCTESIFDREHDKCLAQYASDNETPTMKWDEVKTPYLPSTQKHYIMSKCL